MEHGAQSPKSFTFDHVFRDVTAQDPLKDLIPRNLLSDDGQRLSQIEIGALALPDGELIVCGALPDNQQFAQRANPGSYPVILLTDFITNKLVCVRFSNDPVVSWFRNASEQAEQRGFSTDIGTGCMASRESLDAFLDDEAIEAVSKLGLQRDREAYMSLPPTASLQSAREASLRACRINPSGMLFWHMRTGGRNAILFRTHGDGFFPCHQALNASGEVVALAVPLSTDWEPV